MDLVAMRARHVSTDGFAGPSGYCLCGEDWPCDAAQLLALLTEERLGAALWSWDNSWRPMEPRDMDDKEEWWTTPRDLAAHAIGTLTESQ